MNASQGDYVKTVEGAARVDAVNWVNGVPFYRCSLVCLTAWGPVITRQTALLAASEIVGVRKAAPTMEVIEAA